MRKSHLKSEKQSAKQQQQKNRYMEIFRPKENVFMLDWPNINSKRNV